jgi:hypothetical protein
MADNTVDYGEVMHKFYAGRQYGVRGPNYEDITWMEDVPAPTAEHLAELWLQIKEDVILRKVREARSTPGEYPSRDDMLVALWEMIVEERPEFVQELQARREAIKLKYPKPE